MGFDSKKHLVVLVYALVFITLFVASVIVARNRKIEDAKHAQEAAPVGSAADVAPVASR